MVRKTVEGQRTWKQFLDQLIQGGQEEQAKQVHEAIKKKLGHLGEDVIMMMTYNECMEKLGFITVKAPPRRRGEKPFMARIRQLQSRPNTTIYVNKKYL